MTNPIFELTNLSVLALNQVGVRHGQSVISTKAMASQNHTIDSHQVSHQAGPNYPSNVVELQWIATRHGFLDHID